VAAEISVLKAAEDVKSGEMEAPVTIRPRRSDTCGFHCYLS